MGSRRRGNRSTVCQRDCDDEQDTGESHSGSTKKVSTETFTLTVFP